MTNKEKALQRIGAAEKACTLAQIEWGGAIEALSGGVPMNGCGVFHDRAAQLRDKLCTAQANISLALQALDSIEWPADSDYDYL
ncbi:hypothetical protein OZK63_39090 [Streptomyces sp. UMAF16]|nr:hypothetical protein [Streptomyces sp. UMAF16]